jgi:hypothetical protein
MELRVHNPRKGTGPFQPVVLISAHFNQTLDNPQKINSNLPCHALLCELICCPKTTKRTRQNPQGKIKSRNNSEEKPSRTAIRTIQ